MDPFEDVIDASIAVPANTPTLDNAGVVTVCDDMLWLAQEARDGTDKEFKANSFCPCNVSLSIEGPPSWEESPGSPSFTNDNCNSDSRASI